jgi:3-oxoacyl-[acyl-carrier protein] reductase
LRQQSGAFDADAVVCGTLAEFGINVYEIRPGIIATDMTGAVKEKYDKLIAEGLTPIQRWGTPEDIGRAVAGDCERCVDGGFHL